MMSKEIDQQIGVSYLDSNAWDDSIPSHREKLFSDEFASLPETFKTEIWDALSNLADAGLKFNDSPAKYLTHLQQTFQLDQHNPNTIEALKHHPQKAVAHALLAFAGLTEKESHLISLWDTKSIIAHAYELYQQGSQPWFDFATSQDFSSKSEYSLGSKQPAPLFKNNDCPTFFDFFNKVLPSLYKIRSADPQAAIKIFPQTKNVEAFNILLKRGQDGTTNMTVEWYPGAYTPRDGEDEGKRKFVKNRSVSKEERIVRALIRFDKDGHALVGLKPQKDYDGNDQPFTYPEQPVDLTQLFSKAEIIGNHDNMTSSNNPFIFIKYLAFHPQFRELLTNFQRLHAQLGYIDLVLSGMIGPDTIFAMDMDYETPQEFSSDGDYIQWGLEQNQRLEPIPYSHLLDNLQSAPVLHEFDFIEIVNFYNQLAILLESMELHDLDQQALNTLARHLGILKIQSKNKKNNAKKRKPKIVHVPLLSRTSTIPFDTSRLLSFHELAQVVSVVRFKDGELPLYVTPKQMEVLRARYPSINFANLLSNYRDVASL